MCSETGVFTRPKRGGRALGSLHLLSSTHRHAQYIHTLYMLMTWLCWYVFKLTCEEYTYCSKMLLVIMVLLLALSKMFDKLY